MVLVNSRPLKSPWTKCSLPNSPYKRPFQMTCLRPLSQRLITSTVLPSHGLKLPRRKRLEALGDGSEDQTNQGWNGKLSIFLLPSLEGFHFPSLKRILQTAAFVLIVMFVLSVFMHIVDTSFMKLYKTICKSWLVKSHFKMCVWSSLGWPNESSCFGVFLIKYNAWNERLRRHQSLQRRTKTRS